LLFALAVICAIAPPSESAVKVYDSTPTSGAAGDRFLFVVSTCAPIEVTPGALGGRAVIADDGAGSPTLAELEIAQSSSFDVDTTAVFGPGSFIFARSLRTDAPAAGHVGAGSSAPSSSIAWGVVAGWVTTGVAHCISSPVAICNQNGFLHGTTIASEGTSPTFDLGTWSFDALGDYEAVAPYVQQTANGGESNVQYLLRGRFVGGSLPALPLAGFAAIATGLAAVALRGLTPAR